MRTPSPATVRRMQERRRAGGSKPTFDLLAAFAARVRATLTGEEELHRKWDAPLNDPADTVEFPYGLLAGLVRLAEAASRLPGIADDLDNQARPRATPGREVNQERLQARGTGLRDAAGCLRRALEREAGPAAPRSEEAGVEPTPA